MRKMAASYESSCQSYHSTVGYYVEKHLPQNGAHNIVIVVNMEIVNGYAAMGNYVPKAKVNCV